MASVIIQWIPLKKTLDKETNRSILGPKKLLCSKLFGIKRPIGNKDQFWLTQVGLLKRNPLYFDFLKPDLILSGDFLK